MLHSATVDAMRIGVISLARPTFDVDLARRTSADAERVLTELGHDLVGAAEPLVDDDSVAAAVARIVEARPDAVVVLQATFTPATAVVDIAGALDVPIVVWGFPEPPGGGRLRLNSLCGITLASHALVRCGRAARWVHGDPGSRSTVDRLREVLAADAIPPDPDESVVRPARLAPDDVTAARAVVVAAAVHGSIVGRLGEPPDGFGPCHHPAAELHDRLGVDVAERPLEDLFERAGSATPATVASSRRSLEVRTTGLAVLDAEHAGEIDASLRLHAGLESLVDDLGWSAVAARCWPECFTMAGGAICTPLAMMSERGIATGCEADVLGAITGMVLTRVGDGRPPYLADLVEVDVAAGTGTFWHCGVAAPSLARDDRPVSVSMHPNRRMALANDFELAPGRVTICRLTERPDGSLAMVIGGGVIVEGDHRFEGTTATVRFDRPADEVLATVLGAGLDHHVSLSYGDHRAVLEALAHHWELPVIDV